SGDTDDRKPRHGGALQPQPPSERIAVRKILLCESLVHDRHRLRVDPVGGCKTASTHNRRLEQFEKARAHGVCSDVMTLLAALDPASLNFDDLVAAGLRGHLRRDRHARRAGYSAEAFEQPVAESNPPRVILMTAVLVSNDREGYARSEDAIRIEAQLLRAQAKRARHQQAGSDQKQKRQR